MKKLLVLAITGVMALTMMVGCSQPTPENVALPETNPTENVQPETEEVQTDSVDAPPPIMADIAINIEGAVAEVDGNKITLDSGKVILITADTVFETQDVGDSVAINDKIEVGNFIQGFTSGDAEANEVTADVINTNEAPQIMGSAVVNIEGVITEVSEDGKSFLLDTGKWVKVTEDTEMGITGPTAAPADEQLFEDTFRVGNSIAGFTEDENADELVAYAIYTNWNWEDPVK